MSADTQKDTSTSTKFSLSFSSNLTKKAQTKSKIRDKAKALVGHEDETKNTNKSNEDLVIPCLESNNWRQPQDPPPPLERGDSNSNQSSTQTNNQQAKIIAASDRAGKDNNNNNADKDKNNITKQGLIDQASTKTDKEALSLLLQKSDKFDTEKNIFNESSLQYKFENVQSMFSTFIILAQSVVIPDILAQTLKNPVKVSICF